MESGVQSKIRFAGVAYQHFLTAVTIDYDDLEFPGVIFGHCFENLMSQVRAIESSGLEKNADHFRDIVDLQRKIQNFSEQFGRFYINAFKQFKQQQSELINTDPKMAFKQWTYTFDTQYLHFVQQRSVCREYAKILSVTSRLMASVGQAN